MTRSDQFVLELNKKANGVSIKFKNESLLMKIIGKIMFFNQLFMTAFITTIGKTIYLPSREWLQKQPEQSMLITIAHEYVHVRDYQKFNLLFMFLYLFPLSLMPFMTLLFFVISWPIALVLTLLCLAPLPSPARMYFELRGYTMSLFAFNCLADEHEMPEATKIENMNRMIEHYNTNFTGFNYYLMWPFGVKSKLHKNAQTIISGKMSDTNVIYSDVAAAFAATKPL